MESPLGFAVSSGEFLDCVLLAGEVRQAQTFPAIGRKQGRAQRESKLQETQGCWGCIHPTAVCDAYSDPGWLNFGESLAFSHETHEISRYNIKGSPQEWGVTTVTLKGKTEPREPAQSDTEPAGSAGHHPCRHQRIIVLALIQY